MTQTKRSLLSESPSRASTATTLNAPDCNLQSASIPRPSEAGRSPEPAGRGGRLADHGLGTQLAPRLRLRPLRRPLPYGCTPERRQRHRPGPRASDIAATLRRTWPPAFQEARVAGGSVGRGVRTAPRSAGHRYLRPDIPGRACGPITRGAPCAPAAVQADVVLGTDRRIHVGFIEFGPARAGPSRPEPARAGPKCPG